MRLPWQCPTCYAEIGDKRHAKMLTCPYCGSLLIVHKDMKFLRVPKESGWYYFPRGEEGEIVYGEHRERYVYRDTWYLIKNGEVYRMEEGEDEGEILDEGEVSYLWGEFPFVAPPGSVVKSLAVENGILKVFPREKILFLKVSEEIPDL